MALTPARRVAAVNTRVKRSGWSASPVSLQNTRSLSCQSSPAFNLSSSCRALHRAAFRSRQAADTPARADHRRRLQETDAPRRPPRDDLVPNRCRRLHQCSNVARHKTESMRVRERPSQRDVEIADGLRSKTSAIARAWCEIPLRSLAPTAGRRVTSDIDDVTPSGTSAENVTSHGSGR
jgi:hypothetical protein